MSWLKEIKVILVFFQYTVSASYIVHQVILPRL